MKQVSLKLNYIGNKQDRLAGLKDEANDFIAQIEECSLSQSEDKEMAAYKDEIKSCETTEDLENLIKDLQSDLRFYENREFESKYEYRNYSSDDYGDDHYQKV